MNEMKSDKAPGLDGFPVERLKKGGMAVLEWLVRLFNLSFDIGVRNEEGRRRRVREYWMVWACGKNG